VFVTAVYGGLKKRKQSAEYAVEAQIVRVASVNSACVSAFCSEKPLSINEACSSVSGSERIFVRDRGQKGSGSVLAFDIYDMIYGLSRVSSVVTLLLLL